MVLLYINCMYETLFVKLKVKKLGSGSSVCSRIDILTQAKNNNVIQLYT
jgi:hypothetical protein